MRNSKAQVIYLKVKLYAASNVEIQNALFIESLKRALSSLT